MQQVVPDAHGVLEENSPRTRAVLAFVELRERLKSVYLRSAISGAAVKSGVRDELSDLSSTIEAEIIPRLLVAYKTGDASADEAPKAFELTQDDRDAFLTTVLQPSAEPARDLIARLEARGVARQDILLDLMADAARRLGRLWDKDVFDFTEVTLGLCRLHEIVRDISYLYETPKVSPGGDAPRILLATACADQHIFGVIIVAEIFRKAGWIVRSEPGADSRELAEILSHDRFDAVGLSLARGVDEGDLRTEIKGLRRESANGAVKIVLGGRSVLENPALSERVGADGSIIDAATAPQILGAMLAAARADC